jgi:hypothetical protein
MKKLYRTMLVALPIALAACGGNKTDDGEKIPAGMIAIDLSSHSMPLVINVPDTAANPNTGRQTKQQLDITDDPNGGVFITVGPEFSLSIRNSGGVTLKDNFEQYKALNGIGEHKASVETDTLIVHSLMTPDSATYNHFMRMKTIGKESYIITDNPNAETKFKPEQIKAMSDAAASARAPKPKEAAPKS